MRRLIEDRLFERYRRRGDAEALGRLFDRAAPSLLRVALHLARDSAAAEDLVQATFLQAIRARNEWDSKRPVRPWLLGILNNLARSARRRDARVADPERIPVPAASDPASAAESAEFNAAIDAAIVLLPEVYQPVLRLHLAYDHSPTEIAHALDRAPGTVRSQLARGLELLRKALPAGMGASALAGLLVNHGLAAVRQRVLDAADISAATGTTLATAAMGGVIVSKKLIAIPVAIILATVGTLLILHEANMRPKAPAPAPPTELVSREADDQRRPHPPGDGEDRPTRTIAVPDQEPRQQAPRLRIVDASTLEAIAGARTQFYILEAPAGTALTDEGGFCTFPLQDLRTVTIEVAAERYVVRRAKAEELPDADDAGVSRVLQLALHREGTLSVTVLDSTGSPIADAFVPVYPLDLTGRCLFSIPTPWPSFLPPGSSGSAEGSISSYAGTGADGRVTLTHLPCDTPLVVIATKGTMENPVRAEIPGAIGYQDLVLELDAAATLEGSLAWDDGSPAARIGVYLYGRLLAANSVKKWTDANGRFSFPGVRPGLQVWRADLVGESPRDVVVEAPKTDVGTVTIPKPVTLAGRVTASLGCPAQSVNSYRLRLHDNARFLGAIDTLVDGSFNVLVPAGPISIDVCNTLGRIARVDATAPASDLVIELAGHLAVLSCTLEGVPLGSPIALQLCKHLGPNTNGDGFGRSLRATTNSTSERTLTGALSNLSWSDDRLVWCGVPPGDYDLFVDAADMGRALVREVRLAPGGTTEVGPVPLGFGRIVGWLSSSSGKAIPDVTIRGALDVLAGWSSYHDPRDCQTDEEGNFLLDRLSPGDWSVFVQSEGAGGSSAVRVEVSSGETSRVILEVPGVGRIRGLVQQSGVGLDGVSVRIVPAADGINSKNVLRAVTADGGRFKLSGLVPGTYSIQVKSPDGGVIKGEYARVSADKASDVSVELDSPGTRVRFFDGDLPLIGVSGVVLHSTGFSYFTSGSASNEADVQLAAGPWLFEILSAKAVSDDRMGLSPSYQIAYVPTDSSEVPANLDVRTGGSTLTVRVRPGSAPIALPRVWIVGMGSFNLSSGSGFDVPLLSDSQDTEAGTVYSLPLGARVCLVGPGNNEEELCKYFVDAVSAQVIVDWPPSKE